MRRYERAQFLLSQFGVQTMAEYGNFFSAQDEADDGKDGDKKDESGTYALHTLKEDETIARLATGIKRFKLPDEQNYIKVLSADRRRSENRPRRRRLERLGPGLREPPAIRHGRRVLAAQHQGIRRQAREAAAARSNRRQLGAVRSRIATQPAGKGATVEFRFRNGKQVKFDAHEINVPKLLTDVKAYLKSTRPNSIGRR